MPSCATHRELVFSCRLHVLQEHLDTLKLQARQLQEQHTCLLSRNEELTTVAECLGAQVETLEAAAAAGPECNKSDQQHTGSPIMDQAEVSDYMIAYSSGGGADEPGPDQTSTIARPRSPAMTKANLQAAKASGRVSPFANDMCYVERMDGRCSPVNSSSNKANAAGVPAFQSLTDYDGCTGSSPGASSRAAPAFVTSAEKCAQACVAGSEHLGPLMWGSWGGAAQTASSGGRAGGRSSLGVSSNGCSSAGAAQDEPGAGPMTTSGGGAFGGKPRSSDDTLGSGRASGRSFVISSKDVDQYGEQVASGGYPVPGASLPLGASRSPGLRAVLPAGGGAAALGTMHVPAVSAAGHQ